MSIPEELKRFEAALDPEFLRGAPSNHALPALDDPGAIEGLSVVQSRSLTGRQIDDIIKAKLDDLLGTKWLMKEQV